MPERRRPSPYQLDVGQHVRVLSEPYIVRQPADAANYLLNQVYVPFEQFKQEQLYVLLLDNKNHITHDVMVYKGTVNTVQIRVAELFMEAVKVNAPSVILSHCHPSGAIDPSPVIWRKSQVSSKIQDHQQFSDSSIFGGRLFTHYLLGKVTPETYC
jgi:DNA repair protein RadC